MEKIRQFVMEIRRVGITGVSWISVQRIPKEGEMQLLNFTSVDQKPFRLTVPQQRHTTGKSMLTFFSFYVEPRE